MVLDTEGPGSSPRRCYRRARGRALPWTLGKADPILSAPLTVTLNGNRRIVVLRQRPRRRGPAMADPAQTAGKQKPYLFSQGEGDPDTAPGSPPRTAPASARPGPPASSRPRG
ncbi:hypothetical protein ACRAWD_06060 [Caulobacter segnis]